MIGNRLKLIRNANGLSLSELSELLSSSPLPITRAALSHYELGITMPSDHALEILGKKMGTTVSFFHRPDWEEFSITFFREPFMLARQMNDMSAYIQVELEKILYVEELLKVSHKISLPSKKKILRGQEDLVEELADWIRRDYGMAEGPISSVCGFLEQKGWKLIELPEGFDLNGIAGIERSRQVMFVLYPTLYVVDDFRFFMLREIAHLYLEGEDTSHTEELVCRFARAVLFPKRQVEWEFGTKKREVSIIELTYMKQKYGFSKRGIMTRLCELGIISKEFYDSFEDLMRLHGFPKRKKIMSETLQFYENPTSYAMHALRAESLGLITKEEMEEMLLLKHI